MFGQALSFPLSGKEGGRTFVLGGLVVFGLVAGNTLAVGALGEIAEAVDAGRSVEQGYYGLLAGGSILGFVCYLLLAGFARRVLATAAGGSRKVPAFGSLTGLLADGGRILGVKAGYLAPAVGLAVLSLALAEAPLSGVVRTVARSVAALSLLVFLLYVVVLFYVVPAAVTLFAIEGSTRAAFDLGRLRSVVISEDYVVGWVVGTLLLGVGTLVATLLMAVLVGFFAFFHVQVAGRYCYGTAVGRALGYAERQSESEQRETFPSEDPMDPEIRRRY